MQLEETLREGLKRAYKFTVLSSELGTKIDSKLAEAQPNVQMNGFRKGKAPIALLKKQHGARLFSETINETINEEINKHFDGNSERPVSQPKVEILNLDEGKDLETEKDVEVAFHYEAFPNIPEYDFSKIELERLCVKAEKKEIDQALDRLAENSNHFKPRAKTAKAKMGDQVIMDFIGKIKNEPFEGGSGQDFPLVLGSGAFIPGFEEQLQGVKTGSEKSVHVTFPDGYNAKNLAGKDAVFECVIKSVNAPAKAKIDDELSKKFGADNLEQLKEKISENLKSEYEAAAKMVLKRSLLDKLDEAFSFELPSTMVENEAKQIAHQLWHDKNPDVKGHNHPEITPSKTDTKMAERRVCLALLFAEIGRKNNIQVSDDEMTQALMEKAQQYPGHEQQFMELAQKNDAIRQQIQAPLFENKVVDHILDQIKLKDKKVKKAALEKAVETLDDVENKDGNDKES